MSRAEAPIMVGGVASEVVPSDGNAHPFLPVIASGGERHAHRRLCLLFIVVRAHHAHQAEHYGNIAEPLDRTNTVTLLDCNKSRARMKQPPAVAA
jgi:hypothetical protein